MALFIWYNELCYFVRKKKSVMRIALTNYFIGKQNEKNYEYIC